MTPTQKTQLLCKKKRNVQCAVFDWRTTQLLNVWTTKNRNDFTSGLSESSESHKRYKTKFKKTHKKTFRAKHFVFVTKNA